MRFQPDILSRVVATYESLGLPQSAAGAWCIPVRDARVLIEELDPARHRTILEVGTYVGVSTMLLALHAPQAIVHTVDPNLALEDGTPGAGVERSPAGAMRTLDLAAAAAKALGVSDRVRLHAGAFAVDGDFASRQGGPRTSMRCVGAALCAAAGPFDFAFVDGLHHHDAVLADLELAAEHLAPGGKLVMHDLVGLWGANLRWAAHRFLERRPEFMLRHEPYRQIYQAVGTLVRRADAPADFLDAHPRRGAGVSLVDDPRLRAVLLGSAWRDGRRGPLIELRLPGAPGFAAEAAHAGAEGFLSIDAGGDAVAALAATPASPGELVLALGLLDQLDDRRAVELLRAIAVRGGRVLLGFTPPGERGAAALFSRTLPRNLALLDQAGLEVEFDLALDLERHRHPWWTNGSWENSRLLHLLVAGAARGWAPFAERDAALAAAVESRALSMLYRDLLQLHARGLLATPTDAEIAAAEEPPTTIGPGRKAPEPAAAKRTA